jgi:hypothetical protein
MNIETDKTKIAANIKSINTKRATLVALIQTTAVACAFHAHKHGDVTLLNNLCDAVGGGMKSTALKLWAMDFAPIQLSTDKATGVFAYDKAKSLRDNESELTKTMALAAACPWQDYTVDPPVEAYFNVEAALAGIFKKLEKKAPRPEDAALVAKLKAAAGTAIGEPAL